MLEVIPKRPAAKDGTSQTIDFSTRFKSAEKRGRPKPTVAQSIFTRIVFHGSTAQREANAHGCSEPEAYAILRMQIQDRLAEERRRGYMEGRLSILPPPAAGRRVAA
jgi:hypothetical protein